MKLEEIEQILIIYGTIAIVTVFFVSLLVSLQK